MNPRRLSEAPATLFSDVIVGTDLTGMMAEMTVAADDAKQHEKVHNWN